AGKSHSRQTGRSTGRAHAVTSRAKPWGTIRSGARKSPRDDPRVKGGISPPDDNRTPQAAGACGVDRSPLDGAPSFPTCSPDESHRNKGWFVTHVRENGCRGERLEVS